MAATATSADSFSWAACLLMCHTHANDACPPCPQKLLLLPATPLCPLPRLRGQPVGQLGDPIKMPSERSNCRTFSNLLPEAFEAATEMCPLSSVQCPVSRVLGSGGVATPPGSPSPSPCPFWMCVSCNPTQKQKQNQKQKQKQQPKRAQFGSFKVNSHDGGSSLTHTATGGKKGYALGENIYQFIAI